MHVVPLDKTDAKPFAMPARFHHDIAYFMTPPDAAGVPKLGEGEYWIRLEEARIWLEDGVIDVVSPLDSQRKAEIELTDEQEAWLEWMVNNEIQHVRLED